MGKIRVVVSVRLGISVGSRALSMEEERVVSRQPFHPQVPYEVDRVLVVVYPLSKKGNNCLVSYKQHTHYRNTVYILLTRENETSV